MQEVVWLSRFKDASMPYQEWRPFPENAIVQVRSAYFPEVPDCIGVSKSFWWGYEEECGSVAEGVISKCRRLDKPK
jgi:hypothetical protein